MNFKLNSEQRRFAEEHHTLVFRFLRKQHLPKDEFYDIIIFGYLQAVYDYLEREDLRQYSFTTIAWRDMQSCVGKYYEAQNRQKRKAVVVSLSDILDNGMIRSETVADRRCNLFSEIYASEFYDDFEQREANMMRMKEFGYSNGDIARRFKKPVNVIANELRELYEIALERLAA